MIGRDMKPVVDNHVHLGTDALTSYSLGVNDALALMDRFNVDLSVVFACPNQDFSRENPYHFANEMILDAYRAHQDRLIPYLFVHPFRDSKEEITRLMPSYQGFKLYGHHYTYSYSDLPKSDVIDVVMSQCKPVMFHTSALECNRAGLLVPLAAQYSKTPVIVAHCGRLIDADLQALMDLPNVKMDVSPLATMCELGLFAEDELLPSGVDVTNPESVIRYMKELFGSERLLWGSDAPWSIRLIRHGYERERRVFNILQ